MRLFKATIYSVGIFAGISLIAGCGGEVAISSSSVASLSSVVSVSSSSASIAASSSSVAILSSSRSSSSSSNSSSSSSSLAQSSSVSSSVASSSSRPAVVTLVIEESDMGFCATGAAIEQDHVGFKGQGYANAANQLGAGLTWSVNVTTAGPYSLQVRYANGGTDSRDATIAVKGVQSQVLFLPTGAWTNWNLAPVTLNLSAGDNEITMMPLQAAGLPNVDSLSITGQNVSSGFCRALPAINIWVAGDSTVANSRGGVCPVGWAQIFEPYFTDQVTVNNLAVAGRSVRTWLYDVTSTMGGDGECVRNKNADGSLVIQTRWTDMLKGMRAGDYLFIQFGINDGDPACPRHVGTEALKESYGMMAQAAKARGVIPLFFTPVSALKCSSKTAVASRGFIDATKQAGVDNGVTVIDLHAKTIDLYNTRSFCPVVGGDVSATTGGAVGQFFCDDHTHFDTTGAEQVGGLVAEALKLQAIPLARYLK